MKLLIVNNTSPFVKDIVNIVKDLHIEFDCANYSEISNNLHNQIQYANL